MHPSVYKDLMYAFLEDKISVDEFQTIYFVAVKNDKSVWVEPVHQAIQGVFSSLDAYCEDCTPEEEDAFTITEPTLRKEVAEAVENLDTFLREYTGSYLLERKSTFNKQMVQV